MANQNLTNAKTAKNDEFYTQYRNLRPRLRHRVGRKQMYIL